MPIDQEVQDVIDEVQAAAEPILEDNRRRARFQELYGSGLASDEQNKLIAAVNKKLLLGVRPTQFLSISRALENSDFLFCQRGDAKKLLNVTPMQFVAGAVATKVCPEDKGFAIQRSIETACKGDLSKDPDDQDVLEYESAKKVFWRVVENVFKEEELPPVKDLPDAGAAAREVANPQLRYLRRVEAAWKHEFQAGFRAELRMALGSKDSVSSEDFEEQTRRMNTMVEQAMNKASQAVQTANNRVRSPRRTNQNGQNNNKNGQTQGQGKLVCIDWMKGTCSKKNCPNRHNGPLTLLARLNEKEKLNLSGKALGKLADEGKKNIGK